MYIHFTANYSLYGTKNRKGNFWVKTKVYVMRRGTIIPKKSNFSTKKFFILHVKLGVEKLNYLLL